MYGTEIKCQRMVGQCPACSIGRAVAALIYKLRMQGVRPPLAFTFLASATVKTVHLFWRGYPELSKNSVILLAVTQSRAVGKGGATARGSSNVRGIKSITVSAVNVQNANVLLRNKHQFSDTRPIKTDWQLGPS